MKEETIARTGVMQRAWALLLAAALCLGLVPTMAWAEEGEGAGTFPVALSIVDASDPADGILYNGKVDGMTSDDTVADLLAKAGFTAVAKAEDTEGNDKAYFDSWGSPTFRGNKSYQKPDGSYVFWQTMFDGDSAGYASAQLTSKLQKGGHYQYVYTADTTFSYSDEVAEFPVQLTVVDASASVGNVIKNVEADGMTADDTVKDLLAKAGFKEGTKSESAADATGMTYFVSNNAPYFLGKEYDSVTGTYWSSIFDGGSDPDGWKKAMLDSKLSANGHYQYVYGTDYTFSYSDDIPQLVLDAVNDPLPAESAPEVPEEPVVPEEPTYEAASFDKAAYEALFSTIADSYTGTSEEWKALELAAIGRASSVDADVLVSNAGEAEAAPDATNLQRFALSLTAVGEAGEASRLIGAMAVSPKSIQFVNGQAFALLSYESGAYEVPENALKSIDELIAEIVAAELPNGGWALSGSDPDADITAMVVTALAPFASDDARAGAAVDKALEALKSIQHEDGGFGGTGFGVEAGTNVNSTSAVVIALCALGIDPAASWATASGATPMSALLSQATEDLTAFVYAGKVNDLSTEQGFRALVAYQGLKNTGAAYNIYTQARLGQAALTAVEQEESDVEPASVPTTGDKKALAKTGDGSLPFAAGTAVLALGALAAGIAATRRMRASDELSLRR